MRLILDAPQFAYRSCEHCQKYQYDETRTGRPMEFPKGSGKLLLRVPGMLTLCRMPGQTCPNGTPEKSKRLDPRNRRAYEHYLECRAVGRFENDPIVRRNARLIRDVHDAYDRDEQLEFRNSLTALLIRGAS